MRNILHTDESNRNQVSLKSILLVDDSPLIRSTLRRFIEGSAEWEVCGEAVNGQEGVEQALKLDPDLILMDLAMPVMNGFQAARKLRQLMPHTPIIMLTTFSSAYVEKEAFASGIKAIQSKSDELESLTDTIRALLLPE